MVWPIAVHVFSRPLCVNLAVIYASVYVANLTAFMNLVCFLMVAAIFITVKQQHRKVITALMVLQQ